MEMAFQKIRNRLFNNDAHARRFIMVFYIIGVAGIVFPPTFPVFIRLIPFAILLSAFLLLIFHAGKVRGKTIILFSLICLAGFLIEATGVSTGLVFGNYSYGRSLGIKILNTPLLIGLNWAMLVYMTASLTESFRIPLLIRIIVPSLIMVLYDVVLEQVAAELGMWHWLNGHIPFRNYLAWFLLSLIFQIAVKISRTETRNRIAFTVLASQFCFFLIIAVFQKAGL
jgi:putative membrane protein